MVLTGLTQKKQCVSVRAGRTVSPHLLWHVHALDAVAVDVVVERGVLGAVLGPLPLGRAAQHLLAFPLPCTTTRPQKPLSTHRHPKNTSKAQRAHTRTKPHSSLSCGPAFVSRCVQR